MRVCDNVFCIYEENGQCILEHIEVDFTGRCKECIFPDINEIILKSKKEKTRRDFFDDAQRRIL